MDLPTKAILRSSKSNFEPLTVVFTIPEHVVQTLNQQISSVTINTSCLYCPNTLIDFSGTLTNLFGDPALFSFTLFKTCKGNILRRSVATFIYTNSNIFNGAGPDSQTLKFKHSSCDDECDDCCTYTLELTNVSHILSLSPEFLTFSINGTLSALAVASKHHNFT